MLRALIAAAPLVLACDYDAAVAPQPAPDVADVSTTPDVGSEPDAADIPDDDGPSADCAALTLDDFRVRVWGPVFEDHGCIICHRSGGIARFSDLVLVGGDDDVTVEHDLEVVKAVALEELDGESVLLLRPTGRYPDGHAGGEVFTTESAEYAALERFVRAAEQCPESGTPTGHAPIGVH